MFQNIAVALQWGWEQHYMIIFFCAEVFGLVSQLFSMIRWEQPEWESPNLMRQTHLLLPLGLDSAKHWRQRTEGHEAEPRHGRTKTCTKQASWVHFPSISLDSGCFSLILPLVLASTTGGLLCCCFWCNEGDVLRHRPQGRCLIKTIASAVWTILCVSSKQTSSLQI